MSYNIEIYTKKFCPYCNKAKDFFYEKSLNFKEILIDDDDLLKTKYLEMCNRSQGHTTVPQIFINNYYVGGSDDLLELYSNIKKFNSILYNSVCKDNKIL